MFQIARRPLFFYVVSSPSLLLTLGQVSRLSVLVRFGRIFTMTRFRPCSGFGFPTAFLLNHRFEHLIVEFRARVVFPSINDPLNQ